MNVTVETADLRRALRAVAPHAEPAADIARLHRIRLTVGGENVMVTATQLYSNGLGLVSIWEHGDGELGHVDLSPSDVKQILAVFPASKASKDAEFGPQETLRIEVIDENTTITDVSGLFPGKSLQLPRYPSDDNMPDVVKTIATRLRLAKVKPTNRFWAAGPKVALFAKAAQVYEKPLVIEVPDDKGGVLVTCGESFLGMFAQHLPSDEDAAELRGWHVAWENRFAELPELAR